ncbi:MAG: protein kinase [Balneolaceae bacterium]|nr:protein kinase [Balneolaceae bacterium]MBO6545173.1 protein kinase [Balneolaceae bacterium]MBO6646569.1 protein kinase [Balneolaceae bacterium]
MASIQLTKEFLDHFGISSYTTAPSGGQKNVFIVEIDGAQYALKMIRVADERFEREVKICTEFSENPGIPKIERVESFEDETIILEQYIDGDDLTTLSSTYIGDENKVLNLILNIGRILEPIWKSRYIHRDLKPQNIRVRKDGTPVVLDFGIARALDEASITGTGSGQPHSWPFASPEQLRGEKKLISYRTDFFCLAILAFYLYTGTLPFGNSKDEIEEVFSTGKIEVLTGNKSIDRFCSAIFKTSPSERPGNIEQFLNLLEK